MKSAAASDVTMHKLNEQFKILNAKIDSIIEALGLNDEDDEEGEIVYEDEDEEEGDENEATEDEEAIDAAPAIEGAADADKKE